MLTNLASVNKTLRFRLIPMFETEQNIQKFKVLEREENRFKAYKELKPYLTAYHSSIFENALSAIATNHLLDLEALAKAYTEYISRTDDEESNDKADAYFTCLESCYRILKEQVQASPLYQCEVGSKSGKTDVVDVFSAKFFSESCLLLIKILSIITVMFNYKFQTQKSTRILNIIYSQTLFISLPTSYDDNCVEYMVHRAIQ